MTSVIYPGSFDPPTLGHLNLIQRALGTFPAVHVAIADNQRKVHLFSVHERLEMMRKSVAAWPRVEVSTFDGLLVDYAKKIGASAILRGLRAVSDFEFEFQMAHINRRLGNPLETLFMMTGEEHFYVSSSMVREVAALGGKVSHWVPPHVQQCLQERFSS